VKVGPDHPWFAKSWEDLSVEIHGGLTFAEYGSPCPTYEAKEEWWIGFDCGHAYDAADPALAGPEDFMFSRIGEIRTQDYVEAQCRFLCEQAAQAMNN
jgi:hypothetical protein